MVRQLHADRSIFFPHHSSAASATVVLGGIVIRRQSSASMDRPTCRVRLSLIWFTRKVYVGPILLGPVYITVGEHAPRNQMHQERVGLD